MDPKEFLTKVQTYRVDTFVALWIEDDYVAHKVEVYCTMRDIEGRFEHAGKEYCSA